MLKQPRDLAYALIDQLREYEERYGLTEHSPLISGRLKHLIQTMAKKSGQRVVVLVDEYDKPILDNLTRPEIAREMREHLRDIYSVFKAADAHIKFVFITGVSKSFNPTGLKPVRPPFWWIC